VGGGRLLVVADAGHELTGLAECLAGAELKTVTVVCPQDTQAKKIKTSAQIIYLKNVNQLVEGAVFDDIIYFGADKNTLDILNDKLAASGILNVVLGGKKIGKPVNVGVGRIHYGNVRWIGTTGENAIESYKTIPATGEIRDNEKVLVVGAAGPMGQMHVIRLVCEDKKNVSVTGTDFDDARLASLEGKARPFAQKNQIQLRLINPQKQPDHDKYSYFGIMAPVGALVAAAVKNTLPGALINIFAGIPADVKQEMDMDTYFANRCFMFGTSGSTLWDMKLVLQKVAAGKLNTDVSVDAVSGMVGATDGLKAVENRTLSGKIIIYPALVDMPMTTLHDMSSSRPDVAAKLEQGIWTKKAEDQLLAQAGA
jgi:hypothetical protein